MEATQYTRYPRLDAPFAYAVRAAKVDAVITDYFEKGPHAAPFVVYLFPTEAGVTLQGRSGVGHLLQFYAAAVAEMRQLLHLNTALPVVFLLPSTSESVMTTDASVAELKKHLRTLVGYRDLIVSSGDIGGPRADVEQLGVLATITREILKAAYDHIRSVPVVMASVPMPSPRQVAGPGGVIVVADEDLRTSYASALDGLPPGVRVVSRGRRALEKRKRTFDVILVAVRDDNALVDMVAFEAGTNRLRPLHVEFKMLYTLASEVGDVLAWARDNGRRVKFAVVGARPTNGTAASVITLLNALMDVDIRSYASAPHAFIDASTRLVSIVHFDAELVAPDKGAWRANAAKYGIPVPDDDGIGDLFNLQFQLVDDALAEHERAILLARHASATTRVTRPDADMPVPAPVLSPSRPEPASLVPPIPSVPPGMAPLPMLPDTPVPRLPSVPSLPPAMAPSIAPPVPPQEDLPIAPSIAPAKISVPSPDDDDDDDDDVVIDEAPASRVRQIVSQTRTPPVDLDTRLAYDRTLWEMVFQWEVATPLVTKPAAVHYSVAITTYVPRDRAASESPCLAVVYVYDHRADAVATAARWNKMRQSLFVDCMQYVAENVRRDPGTQTRETVIVAVGDAASPLLLRAMHTRVPANVDRLMFICDPTAHMLDDIHVAMRGAIETKRLRPDTPVVVLQVRQHQLALDFYQIAGVKKPLCPIMPTTFESQPRATQIPQTEFLARVFFYTALYTGPTFPWMDIIDDVIIGRFRA